MGAHVRNLTRGWLLYLPTDIDLALVSIPVQNYRQAQRRSGQCLHGKQ